MVSIALLVLVAEESGAERSGAERKIVCTQMEITSRGVLRVIRVTPLLYSPKGLDLKLSKRGPKDTPEIVA